MWNEWNVGGMSSCGKSPFFLAPPPLFLQQKVYTHRHAQQHIFFGTIFCVSLRQPKNNSYVFVY